MARLRHRLGTALLAAVALCASFPARAGSAQEVGALVDRARVLEDQGAHEAALTALTQAIAMNVQPAAEQARLFYARGVIQDVQGRLSGALNDYSAALLLAPDFAPALNNRANLYRRQGRLDDAKRDYLASLAAGNPEPEFPWSGLGEIAEALGEQAAARQDYARAVAANPGYLAALDRLTALGGHVPLLEMRPIILRSPPQTPPKLSAKAVRANFAQARYEPPDPPALRPALDNSPVLEPQVQLGAWRSEVEAGDAWNLAVQQADGLLAGLRPHIMAANLPGKGVYYRLRVAPVAGTAAHLCNELTARGLSCLAARD